jgi:exodeoxyribonuclease VII small subunit
MSKKESKIQSYESALVELQDIVQQFQDELVNVDQLPEKVKRAAELVKYCQEKLRKTEKGIDQLFE